MSGWINETFQEGLVSVIIPTYNRSAFLKDALHSVWRQTYRPIECIVVDDGSIDDTIQVLREFTLLQDETITIQIIRQENTGAQVARNKGTIASKGEYIQYLDSDDLLYPCKITEQVRFLEVTKDCDFVFGDWEKGTVDHKEFVHAYRSENLTRQILTLEKPIHTMGFLIRRSLVSKMAPWDIRLKRMQEIDFQLNAVMAGGKFCYQPLLCGLWRHHPGIRICNQTTVKDMLPFFQKWECILSSRQAFDREMGERISHWYMWFISQSKQQQAGILLPALMEAVRLNPGLALYKAKKMRFLRFFLGSKASLFIWLQRYRRT